ncbi:autotransporter domain-containing protein [Roseovarius sp. MMSF_3281]|uniref:autotransporter domain-containing protein n=1 Tax=Roseovarius sp. MMSF_3281 TaxID=3046694 RepID=UPI0027400E5C|nr:autotransporter domain-containing protein [Roseovarius sp. MMSF_3281]
MNTKDRSARLARRPARCRLLCGAALAALAITPSLSQAQHAPDDGATLRLLTLNVWHRFDQHPEAPAQFIAPGDYDMIMLQEAGRYTRYGSHLPGLLEDAGADTYQSSTLGSAAILSRLPGSTGSHKLSGVNSQGSNIAWARADAADGRPDTVVGSVHFNYYDSAANRTKEAKALNDWARIQTGPLIMAGDFNAGDVAERGLHRAEQQSYLFARVLMDSGSSQIWQDLAEQYTPEGREAEFGAYMASMREQEDGQPRYREVLQNYFDANRAEFPGKTDIGQLSWRQWETIIAQDMADKGLTFVDETYPVKDNIPTTMNILKKQFMLMQTEGDRERFAPHELDDGSVTWTSKLEDRTNTWTSWDRTKIDHFLIARPFGKWFEVVDDETDPYLGVISGIEVVDQNGNLKPISDHEPVAHELAWVGPRLETYNTDQTRLAWDSGASTWDESDGEFLLTRNNMRNDVYLGQISDENGNPIFTDLTLEEKKTELDCTTTDPRFQQAVAEYCIDDHSFIDETLVADGGTVVVYEDAALGNAEANLRLNDGGLAVLGTGMNELGRDVALEGNGGWLDVRDAEGNVDASGVISGTGGLEKRGGGRLVLSGTNTYTGATAVKAGTLSVNGSIAGSDLLTVEDGARLGGTGTTASVRVASGGTLGAGNSIGTLTVDGDLTFDSGAGFEVETDAAGNADRVDVTGTATINGGSVFTISENGPYAYRTDYEVMTAAGGIVGTFDSVNSSLAFLDGNLSYSDTSMGLRLERNDTAFHTLANGGNARATADAVEDLGMGNALFDRVVMLGGESASTAFDDLSGEGRAASFGALAEQSAMLSDVWRPYASADEAGPGVWISGYAGNGVNAGTDGLRDADRNATGTLLGVTTATDNGFTFGLMAGFGKGEASIERGAGKVETDDVHFGLSLGTDLGATSLRGGLIYSHSSLSGHRNVAIANDFQRLTLDGSMRSTQAFVEASHEAKVGTVALEPFARLAHVRVSADGVAETGGDAALSFFNDSYDATWAEVGTRMQTTAGASGKTVLHADISYRALLDGETATLGAAFAGGSAFDVSAAGMAGDVVRVGVGVGYDLGNNTQLIGSFNAAFGDGSDASSVKVGMSMRF